MKNKRTKNVVGLDIDPSGVTAVEVAVNGHLTIQRAAVAPLEDGIARDGEIVDVEGLATALRALWNDNKGFGKRVRIGLASQRIVVRVIEMPVIGDPKELATAIRFHAQEHIPMPLDIAVLDHVALDIVDNGEGPRQRIMLVAARRETVERVAAAVRSAGLRVEGIDLAAFAMIRALHHREAGDETVLYISIGGLTNLAVAQGTSCLFTRSAGGGFEGLAVELAERQGLTLDHARAWLEHVGVEQPVEEIEGDESIVVEARRVLLSGVQRIAAEVRNTLDYHTLQATAGPVTRTVLTGPATSVPGFAGALSSELGLPVDVRTVDGTPPGLDAGRLTVAAGLAITEALA
jgi:type IV pilus assembly protein PilM